MPRKIPFEGESSDIITGDWHIPFQDNRMVSTFMHDLEENTYDHIVLNGDMIDCYEISRFLKDPVALPEKLLADEIKLFRTYLHKIRELQPDATIIYLPGNHEDRWRKKMWAVGADAFSKLKELGLNFPMDLFQTNFGDVIGVKDFGVEYWPEPTHAEPVYRLRNKLNVAHGNLCRKWAGWTAKAYAFERGGHWVIGHTHKIGLFTHTYSDGSKDFGWENGCMCENMEYCATPDWQRGYLRVHWNGPKFMIQPITWW